MSDERYRHVAKLAGEFVVEIRPCEVAVVEDGPLERCAVYIVVNHAGLACYAGQTRPRDAEAATSVRLKQHRRTPSKASEWRGY